MTILLALSLGLLGVVAGIYVAVLIHDHRIADLTAGQYTSMHQMRDKTFRRVMPVVGLANLGLTVAAAIFAVSPGLPRGLALTAVALLVVDIVLTVTRQVPLNLDIQTWTAATVPANWTEARDRWTGQHRVRAALGVCAYACLIAAEIQSAVA